MAATATLIKPIGLNRESVLAKCNYFVDVQLWPLTQIINPVGWLKNFLPDEEEHALALLNSFQYFSEVVTDQMFWSAFQALSLIIVRQGDALLTAQGAWSRFVDRVVITHVEGETPRPTDSGFGFARRARQVLSIKEEQIVDPDKALAEVLRRSPAPPVVFVDDFVGSGNQFYTTWSRPRTLRDGTKTSFAEVARVSGGNFYYCPLVSTETGQSLLRQECPEVQLMPVHLLSERDSALSLRSHVWPSHLASTAEPFLMKVSKRAGIPDDEWRGFGDLGLTLAFAHSTPDATLPIFYWEGGAWNPLIRRT